VSNIGFDFGRDDEEPREDPAPAVAPGPGEATPLPRAGSRRAERSSGGRARGCLPLAVLLVVILVVGLFGGGWALSKVKSMLGGNPDYSGPGSGTVTFQVHQGDTSTAIGQNLKSAGVVRSVGAFTDAASANPRSRDIQVGYYQLKLQMKASAALAVLVDPKNLIQARVTIPEGYRVKDIVKAIAKHSDITVSAVQAALRNPSALGLPAEANGVVEGYLFPATYSVTPGETAAQLLSQMVAKTKQVEMNLAAKARALGFTPKQILTIASILEYEGSRNQDYPKIAQAIYNRLRIGMALQSDATVAYANNLEGTVYTTAAERANTSPYNTYVHTGLPPGPIGSPGVTTIKAALNPTPGPWLYWVVVNLRTGETRFNTTFAGHQADVQLLTQYCQTSSAC
jgi:UPF0755 protein